MSLLLVVVLVVAFVCVALIAESRPVRRRLARRGGRDDVGHAGVAPADDDGSGRWWGGWGDGGGDGGGGGGGGD